MASSESSGSSQKAPDFKEKEIEHGKPELTEEPPHSPIVHQVKRWPTNPLPVHYTWPIERALDFYDVLLCLIPVAMIFKAAYCVVGVNYDLAHKNYGLYIEYASSLTQYLVKVNKQMTTIFTILFLVIVGTMFKRLALWRAQKGSKMADLELYQASISPASTLRMIAALRIFSLKSLLVASIWVFYYIGSQASIYELTLKNSFKPQPYPIALLGADSVSPFEDGTWTNYSVVEKTDSNSMFHVYSQKVKGTYSGVISSDVVSNALPFLFTDDMAKTDSKDADGFVKVDSTIKYSLISAIGSRFYVNRILDPKAPGYASGWQSLRMLGEYAFNSSYFYVQCDGLALTNNPPPAGLYSTFTMSLNMTNDTITPGQPQTFDFWNMVNASHALEAKCGVQQLNLEVSVKCDPKACKINKLRSRPGFANPSNDPALFSNRTNAAGFFNSLLYACGRPLDTEDTSTFEADNGLSIYKTGINDGTYSGSEFKGGSGASSTSLQGQAEQDLSFAMTKYINTYIEASKHLKYEHGFDMQELVSEDRNITIDLTDRSWTVGVMVGAEFLPNYAISWPWIIIDIVSSSILLFAAIFAFWLRKRTNAPDILGYVSSLTRDNALLDVPGGSALGGIDRTRMMKHVRVKLGEVPTATGVGKITLTYVGNDERCARDLENGKLYY